MKKKRSLSIILSVIIAMNLFSVSVLAEDSAIEPVTTQEEFFVQEEDADAAGLPEEVPDNGIPILSITSIRRNISR